MKQRYRLKNFCCVDISSLIGQKKGKDEQKNIDSKKKKKMLESG